MKSEAVDKFCKTYNAKITPGGVYRQAKPIDFGGWDYNSDRETYSVEYEDLRLVNISMPEDRFRALMEHDEWVNRAGLQNNQHFENNVARVANIIVQHERECRVRNENAAVKAAYEKYIRLLHMVDSYYE